MLVNEVNSKWSAGHAPVAVILISLNEGHNMEGVLKNLKDWAQEVFLVDSYSKDDTVDIALQYGVKVVQRPFHSFGDQWNFALKNLPISAPWTMKLDPDERMTNELKQSLLSEFSRNEIMGLSFDRRLWFMGKVLPVKQSLVRIWRTGSCKFTNVVVNEHPIVEGLIYHVDGVMEHHDSPDLDHWIEKQNHYTTSEAVVAFNRDALASEPLFFGNKLQRRMWVKKNFFNIPFRYFILFFYNWLWLGAWRAGNVGLIWARMRVDITRLIEYKYREMQITGRLPEKRQYGHGDPDVRVPQYK